MKDVAYFIGSCLSESECEKMEEKLLKIYFESLKKALKYKNKSYEKYTNNKGQLPVAFISSNHTTGGNSGSPILNNKGELIGLNFDRNWEGTMSDIMYDPNQVRNIGVDIRYILFIVEYFAGAEHLVAEMDIID